MPIIPNGVRGVEEVALRMRDRSFHMTELVALLFPFDHRICCYPTSILQELNGAI